ncbi:hypothetical protein FRC06_002694 [Ceratobasidium sp. 370]|nr:hypothetical protein FRC06_002694 [Ceratobasidium sp. 370]
MDMAYSHAPVKQEPDLTDAPERHSGRKLLRGAELRSLSIVSWATESLSMDDESDTEMSYHVDGEHVRPIREFSLLSQVPPTAPGTHVGHSGSEEVHSKKLFARSETRRDAALRSYDAEDCKPPAVKREDHPISDLTSHDHHPSPFLPGSRGATRESSYSRESTPTSTLSATPRNAARHVNSPSRRLLLRHRKLAAAFPALHTSSRSKAAIFGTLRRHNSRPKPSSELIDDKRRVFVKQEVEWEVEVHDFCDAPAPTANSRATSSRGSSPITASRASSEEDDPSGLGQEFYLNLVALRSVAKLVAVSGGAHANRGTRSKPLDLCQAEIIHKQLAAIESTACKLRQMLASHFSHLSPNDDSPTNPSCGSASADPPEHQQEDTTLMLAQPGTTLASTESDTAFTPTLDLDWSLDVNQTIDFGTQGDSWNSALPPSYTSYAPSGWHSSYGLPFPSHLTSKPDLAPIVAPALTNPVEDAPMLPVQPLFPNIDPTSTFATPDMFGMGSALYYSTIGPSYQIDPMIDNTISLPLSSVMLPPPSNATFASNLGARADDTIGPSANMQLDEALEELGQFLAFLPEGTLPDAPTHNALPDNPSCSSSLAPNNVISHPTNAAPVPPPAPDTTLDADIPRIPCEVEGCGKTFRRPYLLRDHMRSHSGEGSAYPCTFEGCGKRFGSQSNLTRHYKTHLKRDKPAPSTTQVSNEESRLASPSRGSSVGLLTIQNSATPRRSRRLQNTALNPLGQRGYRILEPRTPATVNARAQKAVA